ncbi:conserved hypothetical protein [Sporisorium reilianum SRZ2]|uniref:SET domain-containing protein n=1 Tax=Sporisorium reilianum (strain SRZ2) TaxID=999809 RepID=E6ZLI0_SPORE|nr:conserved hypothetical protein [Sporisorium reilianum SRZ2]
MVETHIPTLAADQDAHIQSLLRYPASTPHLNRFGLVIRDPSPSTHRGRGVYATTRIPADMLIEISPVLLFPPDEYARHGSKTQLDGYTFVWKRTSGGAAIMALALGLGSLFNHDARGPNVKWTLDYGTHSIMYRTVREVGAGEELTISYGSGRMWWEPELSEAQKRVEEEEARRRQDPVEEALQMGRIGLSDDDDDDDEPDAESIRNETELTPTPGPSTRNRTRTFPPIYRLTAALDPLTLPLTTRDAWLIDIPPTSASLAVKFLQSQSTTLQNRDDGLHSTRHLRSFRTTPARTQFLLCLHAAFPDRSQLVAWLKETAGGIFGADPQPYVGQVPVIGAPAKERLVEWQAVWPCIVRTNPREVQPGGAGAGPVLLVDRKRDGQQWTEGARLRWAVNRLKRVVALARYAMAQQSGDAMKAIASAVHVTHPFDAARRLVPFDDGMSWEQREQCDWTQLTGPRAPLVGRIQPSTGRAVADHFDAQKSRILATLGMTEEQWAAFNGSRNTHAAYVAPNASGGTIEVDAVDQRILRRNPLKHAPIEAVARVSVLRTLDRSTPTPPAVHASASASEAAKAAAAASNGSDYLLTSLSLFTLYEPCVYCTMALLHSRVAEIVFLLPSPGRGACCGAQLPPATRCDAGDDGGVYALQEQKGLNHSFAVWRWMHDRLEVPGEAGERVDDLAREFDLGRLDP